MKGKKGARVRMNDRIRDMTLLIQEVFIIGVQSLIKRCDSDPSLAEPEFMKTI